MRASRSPRVALVLTSALALSRPGFSHAAELEGPGPAQDDSLMVGGVSGAVVLGFLGVGTVAWWDHGLTHFQLRDTGFFEQETYAGGADKAGHFFAAYLTTSLMVPTYQKLGVPRERAIWFSVAFTALLFNGFEVIDGFAMDAEGKPLGFEYGDVIANTVGIALGAVSELFPTVGSIVGARIAYVPSQDFIDSERGVYIKLINDYTGMLFYGDLKLKGMLEAFGTDPGLWRYLLCGVVFGTEHYSPIRRNELRSRNLGFHLSLSVGEILRTLGEDDQSLTEASGFFDYYALPFFSVALMNNLSDGQWFLNFGVANRFEAPL